MGCEGCKEQNQARFTFESAMAMAERTIQRLWIVVILLIVLFVGSIIALFTYEHQFETVCETTEIEAHQDGAGVNVVGGGDVNYGADSKD